MEKKIKELTDEALDNVTGGVYVEQNQTTGKWEMHYDDGKLIASFDNEQDAVENAKHKREFAKPPHSPW